MNISMSIKLLELELFNRFKCCWFRFLSIVAKFIYSGDVWGFIDDSFVIHMIKNSIWSKITLDLSIYTLYFSLYSLLYLLIRYWFVRLWFVWMDYSEWVRYIKSMHDRDKWHSQLHWHNSHMGFCWPLHVILIMH